jgi:tellurite resistance protein
MFPIEVEGRQAMNIKKTALMVALMAVSGLAVAQSGTPSTPRIDQRQANQQQRIDQGVKTGALTPKEAARLEKGQQRVQRMENTAMADGKMTPKERRRIEHAQNQQSKKIYREKHDRQHK